MALEELLRDGDVLVRHDSPPRLVLRDHVHERGRIAVAEPVENVGKIE
jgi:hypothetical protein